MSYLVLARKYRPQTFEEVVGQPHVTTTLANSILADRVAHAILFSGPRGTGKTTVARVLAKTINCCENRQTLSAKPCNRCQSCQEITSGSSVDVFEIDGASNNSVDQVRELRDNARYMPTHSPFKIYIIDEVHMLSVAAFNALLKTLEEPPSHVKFMFATTEPHKIPITILSRCQRHDMRRVDIEKLVSHMAFLCSQENKTVDQKSLEVIAREAGGSVRDALSLLDQVLSCSIGDVSYDQVLGILGTIDRQNLFDLSSAVLEKDVEKTLTIISSVYEQGNDLKKFYSELTSHFRNLLVIKMTRQQTGLVDLPHDEIEQMKQITSTVSPAFLSQVTDVLFKEESSIRFSANPKTALELALLKIIQIAPSLPIDTLIEKLDHLQKNLNTNTSGQITATESEIAVQPSPSMEKSVPTRMAVREKQQVFNPSPENQKTTPHINEPSRQNHPVYRPNEPYDTSWGRFLRWFSSQNPALSPSLASSRLLSVTDAGAEIEISGSNFNIQRVLADKNKPLIINSCNLFFFSEGKASDKKIVLTANYNQAEKNKKKKEQADMLRKEAMNNSVISEAVGVFGGHVETKIL